MPKQQQQSPAATGAMLPNASPGFLLIAAVFLVTLGIYAAFSYRVMVFTEPPTGDQPYYLMTAISLTRDHDIEESNNYKQQNERLYYPLSFNAPFQGIPAPFPLPPHNGHTTARPPNESYSKHGLGLSLLIVPGWLVGDAKDASGDSIIAPFVDLPALQLVSGGWPAVVYELNIFGAILAVQVFLLAWEISRSKWIALAVALAIVFSNPQMTYSYLIFPEMPAGICAIYAFRRLLKGIPANNPAQLLLTGLAIGFMPWLHTRYLPITLALFALAIVQWLRARRGDREPLYQSSPTPALALAADGPAASPRLSLNTILASMVYTQEEQRFGEAVPVATKEQPRPRSYNGSLLLVIVPLIISGLLLMAFYYWLYGIPLPNTQDHAGFINPLDDALGIPLSIFGLLLDQQWGLLVFAPIYLLSFVGLVALFRNPEQRRILFWLLITIVPYYLFVAAYRQWWGEWCPPARYLASITPLLALPLAESLRVLRDKVLYKALFFVLAAVGWVLMAGFIAHPRSMFNHPSGQADMFLWLQTQFGLNLTALFPAVVRWAYWHGYSLNWPLLAGWLLICFTLVLFGVLMLPQRHATQRMTTQTILPTAAGDEQVAPA